jgi:cell division protein FtsW (lipid II flippase)
MRRLFSDEQVSRFLHAVCGQIKAKELHAEISDEILSHISDIVEEKMSQGMDQEQAVTAAIAQIGDPVLLGKQLHQAHKPKIAWGLLGLTVLFIGIGLIAMYAVQLALPDTQVRFFNKHVVFSCIGTVFMLTVLFVDYRKLRPASWLLYGSTVIIMLYVLLFGRTINGASRYVQIGFVTIDAACASLYLFIIALAGIMSSKIWSTYGTLRKWTVVILVPGLLYMAIPSMSTFMVYLFGSITLLFLTKKSWKEFTLIAGSVPLLLLSASLFSPSRFERFLLVLRPHSDPNGSGYAAIQSIEAIASAGMWGQGFAAAIRTLPMIHSEMIFTYLVYTLGWMAGFAIVAAAMLLIVRIGKIAMVIQDLYGKMVISGFLAIFALQFVWTMLMSAGLVPVVSLSLPFVSYGGTQLMFQSIAMGFTLSIYRRKDMISKQGLFNDATFYNISKP